MSIETRRIEAYLCALSVLALLLVFGGCSVAKLAVDECTSNEACVASFGPGSTCGASGFCTEPCVGEGCDTLNPLELSPECVMDDVPVLTLEADALEAVFSADTTTFSNSYQETTSCVGRQTPGPDGFFAVDMQANDRWHFHARSEDPAGDPALYVLPTCDVRACDAALDLCGAGSDEHFSYVAPSAGRYFVAIDSASGTGFRGRLEAYKIICGNGILQHGETCDDGNATPGDGCDALCRVELQGVPSTEEEVNDDPLLANSLTAAVGTRVRGSISKLCEVDFYTFRLAESAQLEVDLSPAVAPSCATPAPVFDVAILDDTQRVVAQGVRPGDASSCNVVRLDAPLPAGSYFIQVVANNDAQRPFDYELSVNPVDDGAGG